MSETRLFGIRHHGPGSARSLERALAGFRPDAVLIEGPPDADALLPLAAHAGLEPPVALLVYVPDQARTAVLYPFAMYSPEWRAIQYALRAQVPVRFIDLPQWFRLAPGPEPERSEGAAAATEPPPSPRGDPLAPKALAAGFADAERWWDHLVESRSGQDLDVFTAVHEMMSALRHELAEPVPLIAIVIWFSVRKTCRSMFCRPFISSR